MIKRIERRATKQPRMSYSDIQMIVRNINLGTVLYKDWQFLILDKGDGFLLQLVYMEADTTWTDKTPVQQKARKWYISQFATESEIVRTAYKAVMASLEHRLGEHFRYCGAKVYNPHFAVDGLMYLDKDEA